MKNEDDHESLYPYETSVLDDVIWFISLLLISATCVIYGLSSGA